MTIASETLVGISAMARTRFHKLWVKALSDAQCWRHLDHIWPYQDFQRLQGEHPDLATLSPCPRSFRSLP